MRRRYRAAAFAPADAPIEPTPGPPRRRPRTRSETRKGVSASRGPAPCRHRRAGPPPFMPRSPWAHVLEPASNTVFAHRSASQKVRSTCAPRPSRPGVACSSPCAACEIAVFGGSAARRSAIAAHDTGHAPSCRPPSARNMGFCRAPASASSRRAMCSPGARPSSPSFARAPSATSAGLAAARTVAMTAPGQRRGVADMAPVAMMAAAIEV